MSERQRRGDAVGQAQSDLEASKLQIEQGKLGVEQGKLEVERDKLKWQRGTFWWDLTVRMLAPILAATAVALIGSAVLRELKPIHLETGRVLFSVSETEKSCICSNVVKTSRLQADSPRDSEGRACVPRAGLIARTDRPDLGEPYYLTSDFVPATTQADNRCYRTATTHVAHSFSAVPRVSLQIGWIDARTYDEMNDGTPVIVDAGNGRPPTLRGLNIRLDLRALNVQRDGFDVVLRTWNDSRIYAAEVTYIAFIQ
jgi:hypothetical protein